jgi:hypothetical protein
MDTAGILQRGLCNVSNRAARPGGCLAYFSAQSVILVSSLLSSHQLTSAHRAFTSDSDKYTQWVDVRMNQFHLR